MYCISRNCILVLTLSSTVEKMITWPSPAEKASDSKIEDDDDSDDKVESVQDYAAIDTYRPATGEDTYGNRTDASSTDNAPPTKYVPPHLCQKSASNKEDSTDTNNSITTVDDVEQRLKITRSIKGILNRLTDSTLDTTVKQIVTLYRSGNHATNSVHETLCSVLFDIFISDSLLSEKLVPLHTALLATLHGSIKDVGA